MPGSARSTGFPARIPPMLAVPATGIPEPEPAWAAEFKWDGVRAVAYVSAGRLRLLSRSDRDMTGTYPELADLAAQAGTRSMVLDGEIAAFDGGRPSFAALQRRMHVGDPAPRLVAAVPVTYLVFDIMDLDGQPLTGEPYARRRAILEAQPVTGPHVHVPPSFPGGGQAVLAVSVRDGLEGVVLKRLDSPYQPGRRSPAWLKIKNRRVLDVVVGGISPGRGHRAGQIGSLLVGIPAGSGLAYAGRVGTGFTQPELRALEGLLAPLRRESPPFGSPVPPAQARNVTWVQPRLVIEVSYAEQTPDGMLRAAAYQGLKATWDEHGAGTLAARRAKHVRAALLRPELVGTALLRPELVGTALLRAELVGTTDFGAELVSAASLVAEQAGIRLGLVRRIGIARHVDLLRVALSKSCPP
jgi:bifunctional non-homologous end joining protein LigD